MASGKKKISQSELRRLMSAQKNKLPKKIVSSVAKYTERGQLMCTVCNVTLVSDKVWDSHKSSKQHLDNVNRLKRELEPPSKTHVWKRPANVDSILSSPSKKLKGILKNAPQKSDDVTSPSDKLSVSAGHICSVCNAELSSPSLLALHLTSQHQQSLNQQHNGDHTPLEVSSTSTDNTDFVEPKRLSVKLKELRTDPNIPDNFFDNSTKVLDSTGLEVDMDEDKSDPTKGANPEEILPEGFFDDPMLDAKARNIEYKDPNEEEWEKFQKVIKEESSVSAQIISEDQDEATVERQIDEIDEQMRNWSRVLDLERRKEKLEQASVSKEHGDEDGSSSAEENEFEEFLDWRVKKAFK